MKKISLQELKNTARQGDESAQYALGWNYYAGIESHQDFMEAARWFDLAAQQGNIEAAFLLATQYIDGQGVKVCLDKACELLESIQDQHAGANYALSQILGNKNYKGYSPFVSCHLIRKSAEQGHCDAMYELACMYKDGVGVLQNKDTAKYWYEKAKAQGHVSAVLTSQQRPA